MRCICPRRYPYGNQIEILTCLCTHITAVVYTRGRGRRWTEGKADGHLIITHTQKVWVTLDAGCAATNEGRYVDTKYLGGWHLFFSLPMWKPIFSYFRMSKREKKKNRNGRRRRHRVVYGKQNDPNRTDAQQITKQSAKQSITFSLQAASYISLCWAARPA